ncbi:kinase-like domain-containing protein [Lactifluus subvellereus]|nr:kinase-like domain-containing protein [Lactifluus subvellereus]
MRLYKQKDIPTQHRNALGSPPATTSPHGLKRATEVVSKQISGHKAMLAQFKELKLPRPPTFSTKPAIAPQTDRPETLPPKQSKVAKVGKPPIVPERSPISKAPTSAASPRQHVSLSGASMKSQSPTKPPGLGVEKASPPVKKASPPRVALNRAQSVTSPNCPTLQKTRAKPTTPPPKGCPTKPGLASVSGSVIPSSKQVDFNESILTVPCFQSLVEDPMLEVDLTLKADFTADLGCQVTQIFSVGLGFASEDETVRRGEMAPPTALPEVTLAPTLEPISAIVELWEPEIDTAVESEAAMDLKSAARADGFETIPLDQNQTAYVAATQVGGTHGVASIPIAWRSHTLSRLAAAVARSKVSVPRIFPRQPLSSTDYEYVTYLGKGAFGAVVLGIHKQSQRQCAVKIICKAIVEEKNIIHDVLAEQRIMREASGHPFLLGLLASFHNAYAFYLVSEYCCSTLFDERHHMPEPDKKLASAELACAVDHLHSLGIIHRDIKLENVMMKNDGHVVLGDFGLAHRLEAPRSHALRLNASVRIDGSNTLKPVTRGVCGTLPYMAPEILCNMDYSYGVDWFAYGVFLHVFYLNKFPWLGEREHPASYLQRMMSVASIGLVFKNRSFGALLNKLFCMDQDARADFSVVRRATFFADIDWQNVIAGGSSRKFRS